MLLSVKIFPLLELPVEQVVVSYIFSPLLALYTIAFLGLL